MEYCASICDPHHGKYIDTEKVQGKAARFVTSKPHRYDSPVLVTSLIQDLGWVSLQDRRLHLRLTSFYKLVGNIVDIPAQYHPEPPNRPARGHDKQYQTHQSTPTSTSSFQGPSWTGTASQLSFAAQSLDSYKACFGPCRNWRHWLRWGLASPFSLVTT